ncbi:3-(2,3-dihydroxyphenyl)propionate dioxygenase [Streptomyces zinciresistens K42]|uniref:3-(2,3-dihydroxyphenyl)propionate dioxygenase n=1 Tax=Streptomyces zinciresistens K42 TaxID=700597 RepID=G2G9F2_9ACTN|nr:hypothetical protein [Streptomyces zinciresistens]EGX59867.1 3-(2,3-dihydroxyphenyl)propionate dioxygenase [Streptomyces zinciresistens K42]
MTAAVVGPSRSPLTGANDPAPDAVAAVDAWSTEWMGAEGGGSAHEVRTWVAAFASLAAVGDYRFTSRSYRPIPQWIAGFAVVTAQSGAGR